MDLSTLNPAQKEAVLHKEGPVVVLAGAGSGKTKVLTLRIGNLIVEVEVPARNILAVTFTKKAAGEMCERLEPVIGSTALEDLNVGTFHSICYRMLREEWKAKDKNLLEPAPDWWQKRVIKEILAPPNKNNPDGMGWDLDISQALGFISWQKNHLITPEDELVGIPKDLEGRYRKLYRAYERRKTKEAKLDFDDMLLWCYELLRDNDDVRSKYQQLYKYILVDEFQDTNLAQYEIIKLLTPPQNNLFVVGDDYQSIYGWRAARVDFIVNFEKEWPGAKKIKLETNYRSSQNIVGYSNQLIKKNKNQVEKTCISNLGLSEEPVILRAEDEDDEAEQIAEEIKALTGGDEDRYSEVAVLYRVNAQARALEDALIRASIPYIIYGGTGFYQRKEIKDILAYLNILENPNDVESIKRVINRPTRYLGKVFIQRAQEYAYKEGLPLLHVLHALEECPEAGQFRYRGVRDFIWCIERLQKIKDNRWPAELIEEVRKITQYDAWISENEGSEDGADNSRIENLNSLAGAASKFGNLKDFLVYTEQAGDRSDEEDGTGKVQMMTMHRAKGLEFPVVFMAGMCQGLFPHKRSISYNPESIEEERRLCYVGMTRAEDKLYLSHCREYNGKALELSVFIDEIFAGEAAGVMNK